MKKLLIGVGLACGLMLLCNINAFAYDENSDIIEQGNEWVYVKNGVVQYDYTGIRDNCNGWWRIESGIVNFKFTGIAANENGEFFIKDGKVDFSYTGTINQDDYMYSVREGWVVSKDNISELIMGVDVSHENNDISEGVIIWAEVANAGYKFAMVKVAGRSTGADGNLYTDSYYEENIQGALAAGMQVGAYFFSQSMSVEEAVEEANYICDLIAGYNITYQWHYSKDIGLIWINCSNTSSKTNTLNLVAAANRNNYLYRCVIKDANGFTAVSKAATLTIKTKLEITKQPESVTAEINKTAEFKVQATGDNLKYQWQYSKDNGGNWINSSNPSSTTDTFNLVAAANRNNFLVRCVITDEYGETIESDSAVFTIRTKLEITKQPESVTAEVNKTAEFKVQATGDNLKYQWQYSRDNGENWINSNNPSSTTDTFNLVAAANRNNFLVRCVITDEYGEIIESDSTILTIEK